MDEYLDIKKLSQRTSLSPKTIRSILSSMDAPPFYKLKGKILIKWQDWEQWLERFKIEENINKIVDEIILELKQGGEKKMNVPLLLNVRGAEKLLGLRRSQFYALVYQGKVKPHKLGRSILVKTQDILKILGVGKEELKEFVD